MNKESKKKIVLFFPDPKLEGLTWHRMPFSVLAVSAPLVDSGYEVKIFDERFEKDLEKNILSAASDAICVGISSFTGTQITGALKIAKVIKENLPGVPLIWGGWHPSIFPEQTARDSHVDVVVYGQGERTFVELADALVSGRPIKDISGLCYKSGDEIVKTLPRPLEDINNFPPLPLSLIDIRNYIGPHGGLGGARTLSYMSSQGCPYRCGFCADKRVYQRRWFGLNSTRVIGDLAKLVKEHDLGAIYFEDNNFFVNKNRVAEICKGMISHKMNILWEAMGHPKQLSGCDDEFWNLLRDSGCRRILIGAESGDQKILDLIHKDADVEDTINFVKKAQQHGITPILSTLVGFPNSALNDMKRTISMVVSIKQKYINTEWKLFLYTPYPGTDLYDEAMRHGLEEPAGLIDWSRYTLRDVKTPWIDDKFRTTVRYVAFFYFHIAYPSKFIQQRINQNKLGFFIVPVFKMVQLMARVRLALNFYSFPVEPIIYGALKKWIRYA